jgi:AcrR family transcriptional regulator
LKQSPKLPAEKRRAQLIKAAANVFAHKGYAGATTEDISRLAGVTKGALYFHFKSKEDIFLEVLKQKTDSYLKKIINCLETETDIEKMMEYIIRVNFEMTEKQRNFAIEFWRQAIKVPKVTAYVSRMHREIIERLARFIEKSSRLKHKDALNMVWLLHALGDGVLIQKYCYCGEVNPKNMINQMVEMSKLYLREQRC